MIPLASDGELNCVNGNFLCGVVEGFYGRPWTTEQRKLLFKRMKNMGLNTYLYAPKDDSKHRMYWRDLYSVEEADNLTGLIEAADENDICFIYALSPGIDMAYSSTKEITFLKRKLEQVASFGCKYFALLFDDIDADMCEADKEIFQSAAHAQVSVTNEVYQHLNQPRFLFCPTEYCASRALPTVSQSEYLKTIGSKLLPDIDIMWTGPKVISKDISIKSIEEVSQSLQRPPIIWDNIHANDYDQKRLFLGPYDGRSPQLIPYLKGVLTNPNCEFEANFVAMHTLSQWSQSNVDGIKREITTETVVNADIQLETDGEFSSHEDCPSPYHSCYQPKLALTNAITEWLEEFYKSSSPHSTKMVPVPAPGTTPVAVTCTALTPTTASQGGLLSGLTPNMPVKNINDVEVNESYMQPLMTPVVNSLAEPARSSDSDSDSYEDLEPMDCAISPGSTPVSTEIDSHIPCRDLLKLSTGLAPPATECSDCLRKVESSSDMQIDNSEASTCLDCANAKTKVEITVADPSQENIMLESSDCPLLANDSTPRAITHDDIQRLVEMFYLPFEHGSRASEMLTELHWLKQNYHRLKEAKSRTATEEQMALASDWQSHCQAFQTSVKAVFSMMDRVCSAPNQAVATDLFPYILDLKAVLDVVLTYVQWLACAHLPLDRAYYLQGPPCSWASQMYRESFSRGDQEPWVFRGGLQAEFQHLLLLDGITDLLTPVFPAEPVPTLCHIRPYSPQDEESIYEVCRKTCDDGLDGTDIFPEQPDLIGDKLVGAYLAISPEYCFTMESDSGICGYLLAALDARDFARKADIAWYPAIQEKYPKPSETEGLSPAEEIICSFHMDKAGMSDDTYARFPSLLRIDLLKERCPEQSAARRGLACIIAALKGSGSHGVHVEIPVGDKNTLELYTKLGFFEVPLGSLQEGIVIMGRAI